ncbi:hypothetical protein [Carnobacterium alterfunditum]|uniref:hypothetical protein n=1 Tax=Carnobacterium alterfunditum TaxID=28230 RepID=UPI0035932322
MKKNISILLVCSSSLLFGCQNDGNNSSEESNTAIADDGTIVTIVPEGQRIYIDEDIFIYGTGMYKITENKAAKMNQKDEINVDGKNYYLLYVFPNAGDDSKEDLYYEEY